MDRETELKATVYRESIFDHRIENPVVGYSLEKSKGIYLGIGMSNNHVSNGLPVDSMAMILGADVISNYPLSKRTLGIFEYPVPVHVLLADSNAIAAGHPRDEVSKYASEVKELLCAAISEVVLCPSAYRIQLTSEMEHDSQFRLIRRAVRNAPNEYVALQMAQMAYMGEIGAKLKVGWAMPGARLDETFFDSQFNPNLVEQTFVYSVPGRTLDPKKPRAPPYICDDPSSRFLLQKGKSVRSVIEESLDYLDDMDESGGLARTEAGNGYRSLLEKIKRASDRNLKIKSQFRGPLDGW